MIIVVSFLYFNVTIWKLLSVSTVIILSWCFIMFIENNIFSTCLRLLFPRKFYVKIPLQVWNSPPFFSVGGGGTIPPNFDILVWALNTFYFVTAGWSLQADPIAVLSYVITVAFSRSAGLSVVYLQVSCEIVDDWQLLCNNSEAKVWPHYIQFRGLTRLDCMCNWL